MSCNALENTITLLKDKLKIIDEANNFIGSSLSDIDRLNKQLSRIAKKEYGLNIPYFLRWETVETPILTSAPIISRNRRDRLKIRFNNDAFNLVEAAKNNKLLSPRGYNNEVQFRTKAVNNISKNISKVNNWFKQLKDTDQFWNKIQSDLQIPKAQVELLRSSEGNTIEDKLTSFIANYSYTIEINSATKTPYAEIYNEIEDWKEGYQDAMDGITTLEELGPRPIQPYAVRDGNGVVVGRFDTIAEAEAFKNSYNDNLSNRATTPVYSHLTVPGGINYQEKEIATPQIVPSIRGHAAFSRDNGIGWFRCDDQGIGGEQYQRSYWDSEKNEEVFIDDFDTTGIQVTKIRRILEVQSDLFQKGRDRKDLSNSLLEDIEINKEEYELAKKEGIKLNNSYIYNNYTYRALPDGFGGVDYGKSLYNDNSNQFLQLLNKDNNWVTFFIKSIIQDSTKKGYEKVLFPLGDTASKIEGHTTLEEFKRQKEDRIEELEKDNNINRELLNKGIDIIGEPITNEQIQGYNNRINYNNNEINQLKQELERLETEGFGALKPIYNFYQNTVTNVLKKQGFNPTIITDEYGNKWNEVSVKQEYLDDILLNPSSQQNTQQNNTTFEDNTFEGATVETLINHKQQMASMLETKKNQATAKLLDKNLNSDERAKILRIKKEIEERLEGTKSKKGLYGEIIELKKDQGQTAIKQALDNDLVRLDNLSKSLNPADIVEAQNLINFFDLVGTLSPSVDNPFFTQEQIFAMDGNKVTSNIILPKDIVDTLKEYKDKANNYQPIIDIKNREAIEEMALSTTGQAYSYKELTKPFKDVDWASMFLMDISQGILNPASVFGQIIHAQGQDISVAAANSAQKTIDKLEAIQPELEKELSTIEGGKYRLNSLGIIGVRGVSYKIFMQKYKSGRETGKLISQFSEEYNDISNNMYSTFYDDQNIANSTDDYEKRHNLYNEAHRKLLNNKRLHSIVFDFTRLSDITDDPELSYFKPFAVNDSNKHKDKLINLLGQKEYNKQIEEQKRILKDYLSVRKDILSLLFEDEGVSKYEDLSNEGKHRFQVQDAAINPIVGIRDYNYNNSVTIDGTPINNLGRYNLYIPRDKKLNVLETSEDDKGKLTFVETDIDTEYYNKDFKVIQDNETLYKFYEIASEANDKIRANLPYELQRQMGKGTLPAIQKSIAEIILDKNDMSFMTKIFSAFKEFWDRSKKSWTIGQEGVLSNTVVDPKTGKPNYKVDTSFLKGNLGAIQTRMKVEIADFMRLAGLKEIRNNTSVDLNLLSEPALIKLAQYAGSDITLSEIQRRNLTKLENVLGGNENISIKKLINEYVTHEVVQSNSFDLIKLLKLYTNLSTLYAAKEDNLPLVQIAKNHYESLGKPTLNNSLQSKINRFTGKTEVTVGRTNAIRQMDNYFNTVSLHKYDNFKSKKLSDKIFYDKNEKKLLDQIDKVLADESTPEDTKKQLKTIRDRLGSIYTEASIGDKLLNLTRFLGLGYNVASSIMNMAEGYVSNMIQAASGEFYDGKHIYYAMAATRWSRVKAISSAIPGMRTVESDMARKISTLMRRYNILMDSKNDLQKSSIKTNFSNLDKFNPYYLQSAGEYVNQAPIMIAMLKTLTITGKQAGQQSSIWDAFDSQGRLLEDFRTEENIRNWEELSGPDYFKFKRRINEAIVKAHGNYDETRAILAKKTLVGKVALMFKTWMTAQIFARLATQQENIKSQSIQKGRYRSFTKTSGAAFLGTVGALTFGPIGLAIGGVAGAVIAGKYGVKAEVGSLKQLVDVTKQLAIRMIGVPVNTVAGKSVIDTTKGFENWKSENFTEVDARNMRANITEIAHSLTMLLMYMLLKSLFSGDDDKNKPVGNFLINKTLQLLGNIDTFTNPVSFWKATVADNGVIKYLSNVGQLGIAVGKYLNGDDIIATGVNAGESNLAIKASKVSLPSLLKDPMSLGFKSASERIYNEPIWGEYFKSSEKQLQEDISRQRAKRRLELKELGYKDKQLKKILDEEQPTLYKLKKLNMTREEYQEKFNKSDYFTPEPEEEKEEKEEDGN